LAALTGLRKKEVSAFDGFLSHSIDCREFEMTSIIHAMHTQQASATVRQTMLIVIEKNKYAVRVANLLGLATRRAYRYDP
jgi:transketolase